MDADFRALRRGVFIRSVRAILLDLRCNDVAQVDILLQSNRNEFDYDLRWFRNHQLYQCDEFLLHRLFVAILWRLERACDAPRSRNSRMAIPLFPLS